MLKYLAIALLLIAPISAQAVTADPVEVKNAVMQGCLGNGGDKGICECSYTHSLKYMTLDDLALLQSQLSSKVRPDDVLMSKFGKATEECGKPGATASSASQSDDTAIALPPPPPPPLDAGASGSLAADSKMPKAPDTYLADIKNDTKAPPAPPIMPVKEDADANAEPEKSTQSAAKPVKKASSGVSTKKRPNGYFTDYDRRFFDAARSGDIDALRAYATKVYDLNAVDQSGDTPLIAAVRAGQASATSFIANDGANVNQRNLSNQAAIHVASYMKRPDLVQILIDAKAKLNEPYGKGYTPLVLAIMQQDLPTMQLLLQNHAGFSRAIPDGNTELHLAASGSSANVIQLLVSAGAKVNQRNKSGYTPLMVASYSGNALAVQALLAAGADLRVRDKAGRDALALANAAGKQNVVAVLAQYQR